MPIIQINIFICELCGASETDKKDTALLFNPTVNCDGWGHVFSGDDSDDQLACPKCLAKASTPGSAIAAYMRARDTIRKISARLKPK